MAEAHKKDAAPRDSDLSRLIRKDLKNVKIDGFQPAENKAYKSMACEWGIMLPQLLSEFHRQRAERDHAAGERQHDLRLQGAQPFTDFEKCFLEHGDARLSRSAFGQLELDAAVAAKRGLILAIVQRLELAEAGGSQPFDRHALGGQEFHH